jgi:peptidoglycan/LPS O-acetylase OafA/YrhL
MRIWSRAAGLAAQTPAERNRYVDFLRAVSILVVVVGHWLIATAHYVDGTLTPGHLLKSEPGTQWLTWIFQVMPIFFIVGGYSNAVSLESSARKGDKYPVWLAVRLNRLVAPLLVLLLVWSGIALTMHLLDVRPAVIQFTSKASLIPTWFLAIYIMLVILAPAAYRAWRRYGFLSFSAFVGLAVLTDIGFFAAELRWLGWSNYFWVWLAVHQLGFAWRDGRLGSPALLLACSAAGFVTLYLLVTKGPYPLAMVGSPDEGLSNTLPPKITLIALGIVQFGLLLALEGPMRRALESLRLWTATVLINSMIMTLYLWHITVMVLLGTVLYLADGFGFGIEPGTATWWWTRPLWIGVLLVLLFPAALALSPLERRGRSRGSTVPSAGRQIVGAVLLCLGISLLAVFGYGGGVFAGQDIASFALVVVGAGLSGLLPNLRS